MPAAPRVVIAGAGHAGGSAAAFLRQMAFPGDIVIIGQEPLPPYQRPPLSKAWLKGEADAAALALKPAAFYPDANIDLRLNATVTAIDRAARTVTTDTGEIIPYDHLILATGARARRLPIPGMQLGNVLELRTAADADKLKAALGPGKRLAVIGGGYIGLEAAASARALGADATVIEREPRVLARVACEILSDFFQSFHRAQGVTIELNAGVEALVGDGTISGVRLSDGRLVPCDAALVGVGAVPNEELAKDSGLACEGGIVVDLAARTEDPSIYAIGDCAHRPLPLYGRMMRLESVPNALEQARQAASDICGKPPPIPEVPWFWSDQYDLRLQIAGIPFDTAEIVVRGDVAGGRFALFHLTADGTVQAVEAVNASTEFMGGRRIIQRRKKLARERIADMAVSMQELAAG
jgi:3-phenylpropionate/trans-cinnamate dioxygenase ferredoxin reductase component